MSNEIIKIPFTDFFANLAAALGIIPVKSIKLIETDCGAALARMEEHGGPIPFVCCDAGTPFFQQGIRRQTNSWAGHAGLFVGSRNAKILRQKFPDLLQPRPLEGIIPGTKAADLPPIPPEALPYEVIESKATVALTSWPDTIHPPNIQAVAFLRDWTDSQAAAILHATYKFYGAPYDVFEIGRDSGFFWWPKFNQIKCCASLTGKGMSAGDPDIKSWMDDHKIDIEECSPAELGRYLFDFKPFEPLAFRCDLQEARAKI